MQFAALGPEAKEAFLKVIEQLSEDPTIGMPVEAGDLPDDILAALDEPDTPDVLS